LTYSPSAATRVFALLGDPVSHSLSPRFQNAAFTQGLGSTGVTDYFVEPGTNGWEIECYEAVNRKNAAAQSFGSVKTPHWTEVYPEERFPGRGYVPQGFTHGTLVAVDLEASHEFYAKVLGMEVHRFSSIVIYVKHPNTRTYIVCAERKDFKVFSPNFRNTLTLRSDLS
jgi:hypothetical protein